MGLRLLAASPILDRQQLVRERKSLARGHGHAHFWQRAAAHSRRGFFQAGATLAAGLAIPSMLRASVEHPLPNPIPGGLDLLGNGHIFHVYLPGTSPELATITDFNGVLGATEVLGNWSGGGATATADTTLVFDADVRFMDGEYIGRETGTTIKAHLRSFESTSTWGGLPPTSVIRYAILIRVWTKDCSGPFPLTRAA